MKTNFFNCITLPARPSKTREVGLTMVLDKFMGLRALEDFLDVAGDYVDIMKFAWGTSRIIPEKILRRKIDLLRSHDIQVCPGGTFFEIAYAQGVVDRFLAQAQQIGFDCIEISDGTLSIPHRDKLDYIGKANYMGFTVLSEVGKKTEFEDKRYSTEERTEHALKELDAGASKIIIEARESGSFGIFDEDGKVIPNILESLTANIGLSRIIFEAPRDEQQQWLILNLGNTVNLGNILPEDSITLETLRCGLRSGTLKEYHSDQINQGKSGDSIPILRI